MLMHQLLIDQAQRTPERLALHWVNRDVTFTYQEAVQAMERMAGALRHQHRKAARHQPRRQRAVFGLRHLRATQPILRRGMRD